MSDSKYQTFELTGFVYKIKHTKWGMELSIRTMKDEANEPHPQHIQISVSAKKIELVPPDLACDDRIKVVVMPWTNEGISKTTEKMYAIGKLNVVEFEVIERAPRKVADPAGSVDEPDDMPF